jgi:hypothetical protein
LAFAAASCWAAAAASKYYTKNDQGQWAWFPADPARSSKGIAYEIGAGETLGRQGGQV